MDVNDPLKMVERNDRNPVPAGPGFQGGLSFFFQSAVESSFFRIGSVARMILAVSESSHQDSLITIILCPDCFYNGDSQPFRGFQRTEDIYNIIERG